MQIGLDHLDPELAKRFGLWCASGVGPHAHIKPEEYAARMAVMNDPGGKGPMWQRVLKGMIPTAIAGAVLGTLIGVGTGDPGAPIGLGLLFSWMGFCGGIPVGLFRFKKARTRELQLALRPEALAAARTHIKVEPYEGVYLDLIQLLMEMDDSVAESTQRGILTEVNQLMMQFRELQTHREGLEDAMGSSGMGEIEKKRIDLESLAGRTTDPEALLAVKQSLAMLERREAAARSLQPSYERVTAQQEVILETLASTQSALARLKVAPAALSTPKLDELLLAVSEVSGQTKAVEAAVQEVLALGGEVTSTGRKAGEQENRLLATG